MLQLASRIPVNAPKGKECGGGLAESALLVMDSWRPMKSWARCRPSESWRLARRPSGWWPLCGEPANLLAC